MSAYELLIERRAEKDLQKLPTEIFRRVVTKIKLLADQPRSFGAQKLQGSNNDYRIRIGDYRVLYEIDDKDNIVTIFRVKHRREVYR